MKKKLQFRNYRLAAFLFPLLFIEFGVVSCQNHNGKDSPKDRTEFLSDLKHRTFNYFWDQVDKPTWSIPDRYPTQMFTSITSTGFGLTAYIIGIENGYITRTQGAERVLNTLRWFWQSEQGPDSSGITGYKGFYYHFLSYGNGLRYRKTELSTIDTGLLMAGILSCQSYFDGKVTTEAEIRALADSLYRRVDWEWAMNGQNVMSMGYHPEEGFIKATWTGYNEAMVLLILALGSPTHPVGDSVWAEWCKTYDWDSFYGYDMVNFSPLFGHQYSQMYIDFRGIQDAYMRDRGIDYFENSRRATLGNRAYCTDNPGGFETYSQNIWGLTACDGPGRAQQMTDHGLKQFWTYRARGASAIDTIDDGTITPTAAGGSIPFAPGECISALMAMKEQFGDSLYQEYGFKDAFNMTYIRQDGTKGWFDVDYIGIDQGPILIQTENYQSGLVWNIIKKNPYIVRGLKRAGFTGGWLE